MTAAGVKAVGELVDSAVEGVLAVALVVAAMEAMMAVVLAEATVVVARAEAVTVAMADIDTHPKPVRVASLSFVHPMQR